MAINWARAMRLEMRNTANMDATAMVRRHVARALVELVNCIEQDEPIGWTSAFVGAETDEQEFMDRVREIRRVVKNARASQVVEVGRDGSPIESEDADHKIGAPREEASDG